MIQKVLQLELVMALLVLTGVWLRRNHTITDQGQDCLTDILMILILPCNIFLSFQSDVDLETLQGFAITIGISVFVMLLTAVLGKVLYRNREERQGKVLCYGLINSNSMFIGLPVIQRLLGDAGVLQLSMYMIFVRIFCWSYGLSLYTGVKSDWRASLKQLVTNPCMLAAVLGMVMMFTGIQLPVFLEDTLQYSSDCLMMISMLLVGVVLSDMDIRQVFRKDVWGFTVLRLLIIPGIVFVLCRLANVPYLITATCTLLSGMPAASLTAVLAARYRSDSELGALVVAVSTVASTATVPLWFLICERIG